uniref:Uncharacterized protein n=3 Tax=Enterobacteriaceae TaxID=543 RepID=A0A6G8FA93_ECOLX|nr:hypothetical protein [Salmonella enterica subsp. enterica serovar Braenderup]AZM67415.1 hypothetical protein [Salmonella enterica subsp. enterica serovar 4,[5],12:i:-]QIM12598.1 hypothetical protein p33_00086 [Escherichia coli]QIM13032.1 hypothetical protein COEJOKCO_00084 [Escherichia coli]CDR86359.1 hypothetical protein [Salmonella enterica subsp. enterica serovar Typhimurium]
MAEFVGSAASQADFIWKNAEDLWGGISSIPTSARSFCRLLCCVDWSAHWSLHGKHRSIANQPRLSS